MSYGLSLCGYDVRIAESVVLHPGQTVLASTVEKFRMPTNVVAEVKDKSSWARQGLQVQNTVIEPGWRGFLTLELSWAPLVTSYSYLNIEKGMPIAQILFYWIDEDTEGYSGKYQNQQAGPQKVRYE